MGLLSAILGFAGGGLGSVIALWADRRKRKREQKRDLTRSERMGLVRVNVKKMRYSSVQESKEEVKTTSTAAVSKEIKDGEKDISQPNGVCDESHERLEFINAVQEMIRGLKSGIVVITGPNDTGKETLLNHAVASCMPHADEEVTGRRWWIFPMSRKRKERGVSFYRVKDMTRQWDKIRVDVLEWFEIRAEKLMTGKKICVVYLDFH